MWYRKAVRIFELEEALVKAQDAGAGWYRRGVNDARAVAEAGGVERVDRLLNNHIMASDLSYVFPSYAERARAELKQKADDAALLERLVPLLEEKFSKKRGA